MAHCINHSHSDIIALAKAINLHPALTASKVAVWQEKHNVYDRFPTVNELNTRSLQPQSIEGQSLEELLGGMEEKPKSRTVAIIGTAGRSKVPTIQEWNNMLADARSRVTPEDVLISGGAAFADHIAVKLFLEGRVKGLKLRLPAPIKNNKFVGGYGTAGGTANYYHEKFSKLLGINTVAEIQQAINKGAEVTYETETSNRAMFIRNAKVAAESNSMIAYTYGEGNQPDDGGTKNTWDTAKYTDKTHVSISKIIPSEGQVEEKVKVESKGKIPYGYQHKLTDGKVITLNDQQVDGLNALFEFEKLPSNTEKGLSFLLAGNAGTGKTTSVKVFIDSFKGRVAVSAPTHKAKKVAAKAIGRKAETIHSLLGLRPNVDLENFDVNNPQFDPLVEPTIGDYSLIVVDEASMINKGLYKLLMQKAGEAGTKIVFMGDNAQLPPINETQSLVFTETKNNVWLTKVERTAGDNPLRDIFTKIRENLFSPKDAFEHKTALLADGRGVEFIADITDFTRSVYGAFTSEEFKKNPFGFAKLIAWKNDAVANWNKGIRSAIFGKEARLFEKGDLIMAYTNIKGKTPGAPPEFENSADYEVIEVSEGMEDGMKMFYLTLKDDSDNITTRVFIDHTDAATAKEFQRIHNNLLETAKNTKGSERGRAWGRYYGFRERHLTMAQIGTITKSADYAYAITSHKSQGSTYKNVYVLESNIDGNPTVKERNQMKYVAFTRASDKVVSFTSKAERRNQYEEGEHAFDLLPGIKNYKTGIDYGIVGDTVDRQIKRLYERLSQLTRQEAVTKDVAALKSIRREIFKLLGKIEKKKLQLDEAKQAKRLEELAVVLKEQLKEAKDIVDNNPLLTPDQITYFGKVLNLIIAAGDFSGDDHILFTDIEMQSPHLRNLFEGMAKEAAELARVVDKNTKRLMEEFVANKTGKEMQWKEFVEMIEDASGLKTNTLNLSRMNNPLLSSIFIEMKEMQFAAHKSAQEIFDKTDELIERALPVLKQLNPSDPFKIFKQVTKNGKLTGNLTFRYSNEFFEAKQAIWSGAFKADGTVNKLGYATALAWSKDNTITFDVRKLFPTKSTDSFQWQQTFSNADVQAHIAELKQQLGEEGYNTLYSHLEKKMERFQMLHEVVTSEIMNNPTIVDKQLQLEYWEKSNSPYWACESRATGSLIKIGPNIVPTEGGAKYTYNVPRRVTLNGKRTEWYDKQFEQIEANPALLEFYNYFLETLGVLNKMIPAYKREGYQINTLPTIRREILEMFKDNPASIGKEMWGKVIEATRVDDLAVTDYSEIDPLTGKGDPRIAFHNVDTKKAIADLTNIKRVEWEQANPGKKPTLKEARKWKEDATDEIASRKSYDLGKVLRAYSMQVLSYHHKASTENLINLAVNAFNNITEVEVNSAGEAMTNQRDFLRKKEGLENLKDLLNYQQRVYANLARHDVELKTDTKVFTPEEKEELKHLDELEKEANEQLSQGIIDQAKYNNQIAVIEEKREKLGGLRVGSKIGDMVLQWVQLLGMGWNLVGSFANRAYGKVANWTEASDGRLFGLTELRKAEMLTLNSVGKNLTFNHWEGVNGMALKIRSLMDKFDVLQETRNELYKSSTGSKFLKKFLWLNPYQLNARTEYLNQAEAFIARLLRLKVSEFVAGYTGTESLWDAFDKDGNWNIQGVEEPDLTNLRVKIDNMVNRLHGDYSNIQKGKKSIFGRAMFQFRSWMPEMFFARFGAEWEDHIEGITRKGRYRSMTPFQHLLTAGIFTGVAFGAPGFLIGTGLGLFTGKVFGMKSPMNMAEELLFNLKILTRKAQFSDEFTEVDAANMRANMMELAMLMSLYGVALVVKAAFGDDDEDYTKYAVNLMLNQMTRMQTDILFYTNPLEFEKLSKNALPVFGLVADTYHWIDAAQDTINGEGEYKTGIHKGDSKIARYTRKLLPGLKQGERWFSAIEQQYER